MPKYKKRIENPDQIGIDEIRRRVWQALHRRMSRSSVYYYIERHGFPCPSGLSAPRRWDRREVLDWLEAKSKEKVDLS